MMTLVASYAKLLDNNLTAPQYFILQTLAKQDLQTSSYFAGALDVTLSAITNLSSKLVQKGYIERVISETDRRQVLLKITEQGREVEQSMMDRYRQLTAGLWDELNETELDLMISSYQKMIAHLEHTINGTKLQPQGE
ncbi:MarR family winged helix-turn-helix transcriptional regulator [Paenibacillus tianjinensis]|uniref:MarR family transcriptional regulator n=1 Tax=Paenibacillus tianjinensis TaxID=2810347 RepID=A0ABX7L3Z0_9BACL|nr:MarR family transcriptional regulator [Paenibacillus tianjinensis]QSF42492.1 MarR family transcriptional regulator [Paenibacillus tianjinensis]